MNVLCVQSTIVYTRCVTRDLGHHAAPAGQEEAGATAPRRPQKHAQSSRLTCGKRTPGPARACTPMRHWLNRIIFALARNHALTSDMERSRAGPSWRLSSSSRPSCVCPACWLELPAAATPRHLPPPTQRGAAFFGPPRARDCCCELYRAVMGVELV